MFELNDSFLHSPLFLLTLSLVCFELARLLYQKSGHWAILQPTLVGAIFVAIVIYSLDVDFATYLSGNQFIIFLLGPATVALAVPMFMQLALLKKMLVPLLLTSVIGAVFAALSVVILAYLLGASTEVLWSIAPKSVTTPIAVEISKELHAETSLTVGVVVITAIVGIVTAPILFKYFNINDPRIQGFSLGITAHGVGVARAFEKNQIAGAFASLALCLTGSFSAVFIPLSYRLLSL